MGRTVLTPLVLGAGAALVALLVGFLMLPQARYQISSAGPQNAWRIDTVTGHASYCRTMGFEGVPICSAWGTQSIAEYRTASAARRPPPQLSPQAGSGMDPGEFRKLLEESTGAGSK